MTTTNTTPAPAATRVDDGGPAFPVEVDANQPDGRQTGNTVWQAYGMSLRDYFAAQSLSTIISLTQHRDGSWDEVAVAVGAYAIADAMLQARKQ
jgi:hypothetical protein